MDALQKEFVCNAAASDGRVQLIRTESEVKCCFDISGWWVALEACCYMCQNLNKIASGYRSIIRSFFKLCVGESGATGR